MPPKRKALSCTTGNATKDSKSRVSKATKTRGNGTRDSKSRVSKTTKTKTKTTPCASTKRSGNFRFSSVNSLKNKPVYLNLQWHNISRFMNDPKCQDKPKPNELVDEYCHRVSDLGIPLSKDGGKSLEKFGEECDKRNQDIVGIHICSDWNGYGVSEVMENFLKEFNREVDKKSISPYRKWAYVETLACYVMVSAWVFINTDDADSVHEIINMLGLMIFTCFSVLAEHDLFKPDSEVKNIEICCLILLEFLVKDCVDFEIEWACEIVRQCYEAGFDLDGFVRKQVNIKKKDLQGLRRTYKSRASPEEKSWNAEYKLFHVNHRGGTHYDLSGMSEEEKKMYSFDTDDGSMSSDSE